MPTIAIVGAGPQFGQSVARAFGAHGFDVALIARRRDALDELVRDLADHDITAAGFVADVRDREALTTALADAEQQLGPIEVLSYSPLPSRDYLHPLDETTLDQVQDAFAFSVLGSMTAVQAVLPGMRQRGRGSLLFTSGGSAITPNPKVAGTSIAMAGEAAYAQMLRDTLAADGVNVGHLVVRVAIAPGSGLGDPDALAGHIWELHESRGSFPRVID
jgi:NADP-dependent 3-hydroxy acid dehydrogenase YdfG